FISAADERFGPITIIRQKGKPVKKIPWTAFKLKPKAWLRVVDIREILADPHGIQQSWSSSETPTIYSVLPAYETLLRAWTIKRNDPKYTLYHSALDAGFEKFDKYYSKFDLKPSYILAMFVHPNYKLLWTDTNWGGADAQKEEIAKGNKNAKNWQEEARKVVETAVRYDSDF
ncbi:hypothetical protein BDZ89DRAFT_960222, partial [Hymenopellis radicata]